MNKTNSILLRNLKILVIFLLSSFSFQFTGCENFMEGSELKDDIQNIIKYENAQQITVLIQADEGTGTPVPSGNQLVKIGYPFEINFTENSEYSFSQ